MDFNRDSHDSTWLECASNAPVAADGATRRRCNRLLGSHDSRAFPGVFNEFRWLSSASETPKNICRFMIQVLRKRIRGLENRSNLGHDIRNGRPCTWTDLNSHGQMSPGQNRFNERRSFRELSTDNLPEIPIDVVETSIAKTALVEGLWRCCPIAQSSVFHPEGHAFPNHKIRRRTERAAGRLVFIIKKHESELTLWDIEFGDLVNLIDKEQGRIIVVVQYQTIESWVRANCRNHCGASEVGGCRVDKPSHEETLIATLIRDIHLDVLSSDEYSKPLHRITSSTVQRCP